IHRKQRKLSLNVLYLHHIILIPIYIYIYNSIRDVRCSFLSYMKGGRDSIDALIQIIEESNKEWEKNKAKDVEFPEFSKKKKGFRNDVKRVLVHESKKVFHEIITEDEASGKKVKYSEFCEAERVLNILKYAQFRKIETEDNEEDWEYTEVIVGDPAEEFEDAEYREIPLEGAGKVVEDAEYRDRKSTRL